jgi:predicted transport protein
MDPNDIRVLRRGQCGTSVEGQGSHYSGLGRGHKGPVRPTCIETIKAQPILILFSTLEDLTVFRGCLLSCWRRVSDTPHFDMRTKPLKAEKVWSKSISNKGHFTLEDLKVFGTYHPSYSSRVPDASIFDIPPKDLEAQPVWSEWLRNEGHFTLEDATVLRTYLPKYSSRVTDTPHFDILTKPLDAEQDWPKSVSNKGHFTLEDLKVSVTISIPIVTG